MLHSSMTSADRLHILLPLGYEERRHKSELLQELGFDEIEFQCCKTILIETGQAVICHDPAGYFYLPASAEDLERFGADYPNELRSQLAFFYKQRFSFHEGA